MNDYKMCDCDEAFLETEEEIVNGRCSFCQGIYNKGRAEAIDDCIKEIKGFIWSDKERKTVDIIIKHLEALKQ